MFDGCSIRLGIHRAVRLMQSTLVEVPTVIGWLRPVVLIPVSCLTGLSTAQVEAIFCHELAHVRRHDYLVSVIQSVVEALLFYHPAVWWVSKQLRRERECCCDELAVGHGGDVLAYARALSYLEERRASFPEFALGANGGVLSMRIKRLLGYQAWNWACLAVRGFRVAGPDDDNGRLVRGDHVLMRAGEDDCSRGRQDPGLLRPLEFRRLRRSRPADFTPLDWMRNRRPRTVQAMNVAAQSAYKTWLGRMLIH